MSELLPQRKKERKNGRKKEKPGVLPKSAVSPSHPTTVACIG